MSWENKTKEFCDKYNISVEYLADTLNEPKVIPMIRGKAFEFSVYEKLVDILDPNVWEAQKNVMNAQLGSHDEDVTVLHKASNTAFGGECKLAGKGRFKFDADENAVINIKCMRSRTLGQAMVEKLAPQYGISTESLAIHNDQYLPSDFAFVITSIGNAFYQTDENGLMYWHPTESEIEWLKFICDTEDEDLLQDLAFNKIYIISSRDISIHNDGYQNCTRRKCDNKNNCGFIPNYPKLTFEKDSRVPSNGWYELEEAATVLNTLL